MIYTETIKLQVKSQGFSNITGKVQDIIKKSKIKNGICTVFAVGATGSIIVNEDEPMLLEDLRNSLEVVSESDKIYHHTGNAYSHIRSALLGSSQTIPVKDSELTLGTWQDIMVANFDTREREREIVVTIIGE